MSQNCSRISVAISGVGTDCSIAIVATDAAVINVVAVGVIFTVLIASVAQTMSYFRSTGAGSHHSHIT